MKNCPRKIRLRAAKAEDSSFCPPFFDLSPAPNSANLKRIVCNSGVTVPLKLLAIEETKNCNDIELCARDHSELPAGRNFHPACAAPVCYIGHEQFAHIYVTTELSDPVIKHYIVIFVAGVKIGKRDELAEILCNTVKWLKIEHEQPHFYIYYFGKQPVINNEINNARDYVARELRNRLSNYKKGEAICMASNVSRDSTDFTISSSNPYQFNIA
jgi:hypothetical protein